MAVVSNTGSVEADIQAPKMRKLENGEMLESLSCQFKPQPSIFSHVMQRQIGLRGKCVQVKGKHNGSVDCQMEHDGVGNGETNGSVDTQMEHDGVGNGGTYHDELDWSGRPMQEYARLPDGIMWREQEPRYPYFCKYCKIRLGSKELRQVYAHCDLSYHISKKTEIYNDKKADNGFIGLKVKYPRIYENFNFSDFHARNLPPLFKACTKFHDTRYDRIVSSQWISNKEIAFGTKCNKLLVLNIENPTKPKKIPLILTSSGNLNNSRDIHGGISSLAMSPGRDMLAANAHHTNDMAIYEMPSFKPLAVLEGSQVSHVSDVAWVDYSALVTGSVDATICLWDITRDTVGENPNGVATYKSTAKSKCAKSPHGPVEALAYMNHRAELAVLNKNGRLHIFDLKRFEPKGCPASLMPVRAPQKFQFLRHTRGNTCIAANPNRNVYAIGSESFVSLYDSRSMKNVLNVKKKPLVSGICSVSFDEDILTFGAAAKRKLGGIYFYDLRANDFLEMNSNKFNKWEKRAPHGWYQQDLEFQRNYQTQVGWWTLRAGSVYTHCYDPTHSKLFMGGGPFQDNIYGNFAALWECSRRERTVDPDIKCGLSNVADVGEIEVRTG